jgi:hypothetical protein
MSVFEYLQVAVKGPTVTAKRLLESEIVVSSLNDRSGICDLGNGPRASLTDPMYTGPTPGVERFAVFTC